MLSYAQGLPSCQVPVPTHTAPLLPTWGCAPESRGDRQSPGKGSGSPRQRGCRLGQPRAVDSQLTAQLPLPASPQLRPPDALWSHAPEWPSDVFSPQGLFLQLIIFLMKNNQSETRSPSRDAGPSGSAFARLTPRPHCTGIFEKVACP